MYVVHVFNYNVLVAQNAELDFNWELRVRKRFDNFGQKANNI